MRGAVMTSDALIASLIVVLIIIAWAQAHSLIVGRAAAEAQLEAKKMRLLAFSDAAVRAVGEEKAVPASAPFGVRDAQMKTWAVGSEEPGEVAHAGLDAERICMRRLVSAHDETKILEVCA